MAKKKIIWAVDVFGEEMSLQDKAARMVNQLSESLGADVIPTFVMGPSPFLFHQLPMIEGKPYLAEKDEALEKLQAAAKAFEVKSIQRCEVLLAGEPSVRSEADRLIQFARKENADLIVLSSQARKAVERFFIGSFAETMVLRSPVPLMLVQPKTEMPSSVKEIVFPTDFSEKSRQALAQVETLAKATGATIHLFHHLEHMTPSFRDLSLPPQSRIDRLIRQMHGEMKKEKTEQGQQWVADLKKKGTSATSTVSEAPVYVVDDVLEFAKAYKSGIIAVASHSQPGFAEILGGVARRLVRQSPVPVWVVHPSDKSKA